MSDPDDDTAMWPSSPYALADTESCPSCFNRLTAITCSHCGLALADPRAREVLKLGRQMLSLEGERQKLIDEIRLAHPPVPKPAPAALPQAWWEAGPPGAVTVSPEREPSAVAVAAAAVVEAEAAESEPRLEAAVTTELLDAPVEPSEPPNPPVPTAASAPAKPPRRRLTVPVLLLIVGVSLVGVAAIFFLVLAWNVADIGMRALIIGGVTLATMVAASLLRRWSLTATAEGIGALGIILLSLDGWAVRANDLFGAGGMDPVVYAGVTALTLGAICRVWAVFSRLRGPDIAATLALPAGVGLLVAGLVPLDTAGALAAGFLGAAAGGLAHALPAPWSAARSRADAVPERTALAAIGTAALLGAGGMLAVGLESMPVQLVAGALVIVLGVAYAVVVGPRADVDPLPAARVLGIVAGAVAGATAASLGWQMAVQSDLPVYSELIAPVVAVAVAVGLDRRHGRGRSFVAARIASAFVAAVSLIALVAVAGVRAGEALGVDWVIWRTPAFEAPADSDITAAMLAAIAALVVSALLFFAPTLARPAVRDLRAIAAAVLVLVGVMGTGIPVLIVGAAVVIATAGIVCLARGATRIGWGVVAGIAAVTAFLAGLAVPWLWGIGVVVAIVVPIIARIVIRPQALGAVLLILAPVGVAAVAAFIAPAALGVAWDADVDERAAFVLVQWVAFAALLCAVALRLDAAGRTALAASSYVLLGISLFDLLFEPAADGTVSASIGEPVLTIIRPALLLVLLGAVALVRTRIDALPSLGAAALLAPAAACTVIGVFETLRITDVGWISLVTAGAATAVVWLGALVPRRVYGIAAHAAAPSDAAPAVDHAEHPSQSSAPAPYATLGRRFADGGALATVAAAAVVVTADFLWAMLLVIAVALAGASVTRGWAAPATDGAQGVPQTRAVGVPLALAPRRLLAWPALAAATLALWLRLDGEGTYEVEAFVLPPAVGLLVFAAVLVWLRRHVEATIAVVAAFTLGLVLPAIVSVSDGSQSPVRGTVIAIVAGVLTAALAWTPVRRVRVPALAASVVAIVALGVIAVDRALTAPAGTAWLLLLVGAAYLAAFGFLRGSVRHVSPAPMVEGAAPFVPEAWFATLVPPVVLATAAVAAIPWLDMGLVAAVAIAIQGALHLASAAVHRVPLGAATRWTALAGATVAAGGALLMGDVDAIELVTLPLAGVLLAGAVLAMWRLARAGETWPGGERIAWLVGIALAVAPSVVAAPNDPRTWLVIAAALLAAIGCLVAPIPDAAGLKTPSALILAAGALAMGVRALLAVEVDSGDWAAVAAGAGALLVAATMVWMDESDAAPTSSTVLAAAGAALAVGVVFVQSEGELAQASLTAAIAGAIAVAGAALLRWPRWAGIGGVLAIGGLIAALISTASRFAIVATMDGTGVEPDLWALVGVGILVAVGVMALRSTTSPGVATAVGVVFSVALVLFAAAELILLGNPGGDQLRTVLTMSALVAVGIIGWLWRSRLGPALAPTAAVAAGIFGILALVLFAVRPLELVTVPPALGMIFLGARALRLRPGLRTWPALGPGLALLTVPSLLYDFGTTTLWRVVALGIIGVALVVVGAVRRLQAPLILGSVVVLVHAVSQLWPWISDIYRAVPWWLWLGIGGALLIFLAARYERRMRALRAAFVAVTSLR